MDTSGKNNSSPVKVHLGCGKNTLDGFLNLDGNIFVILKYIPFIERFLGLFNFIPKYFCEFISIARKNDIRYCDAARRIPFGDSTVDLVYSCHMLEHLDQDESRVFFDESYRILKKNGIMRIVVPDFQKLIDKYESNKDVDRFIERSCLVGKKPKTLIKKVQYLLQGHGWHHQMFNENSLTSFKKLEFSNVELMKPGETNIAYPNSINLMERKEESLYFEFIK